MEKRIETLEKQVRLYKRVSLLAVCLIAGALIAGAVKPTPKVVEAEKFVLKDAEGKIRGKWQVDKDGPVFLLVNKDKREMQLSINDAGSRMGIFDTHGTLRVVFGMTRDNETGEEVPGMIYADEKGNPQVSLGVGDSGTSFLDFANISAGKARTVMGMMKGAPLFYQRDNAGEIRTYLRIKGSGEPALQILNENEKVIWSAPPTLEKRP